MHRVLYSEGHLEVDPVSHASRHHDPCMVRGFIRQTVLILRRHTLQIIRNRLEEQNGTHVYKGGGHGGGGASAAKKISQRLCVVFKTVFMQAGGGAKERQARKSKNGTAFIKKYDSPLLYRQATIRLPFWHWVGSLRPRGGDWRK